MNELPWNAKPWDYLKQIWALRHFCLSLVRKDVRSRYRQSYLSVGWSLVRPMAMCVVLCVIFSKLLGVDILEYGPFLLVGLTIWQFFAEVTLGGCSTFLSAEGYIRQQPLPLAIFPLRTALSTGFHALVALGVTVVFVVLVRGPETLIYVPLLVPAVVMIFLLGWFLALLAGIIHTHFTDTQNFLEIGLQLTFYLTPVIYPASALEGRTPLAWVLALNPFSHFLEMVRQPLLRGEIPALDLYMTCLAIVVVVGAASIWCLRRLERTLVFWV